MSDAFIGEIRIMPYSFTTKGWLPCAGQLLPVSGNQALFALLSTAYGGDGRSTFGLPDLRGRVIVGALANMPAAYPKPATVSDRGVKGGAETVTLTEAQMPAHTHAIAATTLPADVSAVANGVFATVTDGNLAAPNFFGPPGPQVTIDPDSLTGTGHGQAHNNMQPYTALTYCICVQGQQPSRN